MNCEKILIGIDRDGTIIENNDFFGKNKEWIEEIKFNKEIIEFLLYLQTKYKTTKLIITNQAGVARRFFDCKRVEEINRYIDLKLSVRGIKIDDWQYCPYVDSGYASQHPGFNIAPKYIQNKTKRKPNPQMLFDALKKLNKKLEDFDRILILGDRQEDKGLSDKLNAQFIDVSNKKFDELVKEVRRI